MGTELTTKHRTGRRADRQHHKLTMPSADRLTTGDRLAMRIAQFDSDQLVSRGQVASMIRAGMVFWTMMPYLSPDAPEAERENAVADLCAHVGHGGQGYEPWYVRMAMAFYASPRLDLATMTMYKAQQACGVRDQSGRLLPEFDPAAFAGFERAMEVGEAA